MKKSKKLLALVLALVMAVSILALPASAKAIDNGAIASPNAGCAICGGRLAIRTRKETTRTPVPCIIDRTKTDIVVTVTTLTETYCTECLTILKTTSETSAPERICTHEAIQN